jgi:hypothetical protein
MLPVLLLADIELRLGGGRFSGALQISIEVTESFQKMALGEITRFPLGNIQRLRRNLEAILVADWDFSTADSDKHEDRELPPKRIVGVSNGFTNFANFQQLRAGFECNSHAGAPSQRSFVGVPRQPVKVARFSIGRSRRGIAARCLQTVSQASVIRSGGVVFLPCHG